MAFQSIRTESSRRTVRNRRTSREPAERPFPAISVWRSRRGSIPDAMATGRELVSIRAVCCTCSHMLGGNLLWLGFERKAPALKRHVGAGAEGSGSRTMEFLPHWSIWHVVTVAADFHGRKPNPARAVNGGTSQKSKWRIRSEGADQLRRDPLSEHFRNEPVGVVLRKESIRLCGKGYWPGGR